MEPSSPVPNRFRFGVFEVDLEAGELRKRGRKIRLQDQPLQVLALLIRSPGEVVTREQLQRVLWPAETFVEFDQGLNTAVKKVRLALGDSADNPRFIETLPRKGYRFIAPLSPITVPEHSAPGPTAPAPLGPGGWWRDRRLWVVSAASFTCAVAIAIWLMNRPPPPMSRPLSEFRLTQLTRDPGLTAFPALSPDGKLVAYSSDRAGPGNMDIWVQQVDGGAALRLTSHEAADVLPAFSPDGAKIAFVSTREGGGVYVIPAIGGEARLLSKNGERPQFSPDGSQVAYQSTPQGSFDESRIYVVPAEGGPSRRLEPDFVAAASPVWTPDGKHVAFVGVHPKEGFDVWVSSLGRKPPVRTGVRTVLQTQRLGMAGLDAWVAEGNYLIFSAPSGDSVNLWRLPVSRRTWQVSGSAERLTLGIRESHGTVARGGRLAFGSITFVLRIASLPIDANRGTVLGDVQYLTDSSGNASGVNISADSRILTFRSDKTRRAEIWAKDLVTGRETALTDAPKAFKSMPRISFDGSKVAFERSEQGRRTLFLAKTRGGPLERICDNCGAPAGWFPDGESILTLHTGQDQPRATIHVLNLRTGQQRLLLKHPQLSVWVPSVSWDGRSIVFKVDLDQRRTLIHVAHLDGPTPPPVEEWVPLTEGRAWDDLPHWSPNGNLIYFTSDRDGYRCLWARRLDALTKRPLGEPFPIRHFHDAQRTMTMLSLSQMDLAVARARMVFPMAELKGNIWMMEPRDSATR